MEIYDEWEGGRERGREGGRERGKEDRREGGEGGGDMDVLSGPDGGRQTEQWSTGNLECPLEMEEGECTTAWIGMGGGGGSNSPGGGGREEGGKEGERGED